MKKNNGLKITLTILLIILISFISFVGIYIKNKNTMTNILPDYLLGMDLKGGRNLLVKVDNSTKTKVYDKDGKLLSDEEAKEAKDTVEKEEPVNPENVLNAENYAKVKQVVEKRLALMNVYDYTIRFNSNNGDIYLQIPEDSVTDIISQYCSSKGLFQVIDDETKEVLLTNEDLKSSKVGYNTLQTGTTVYLQLEFTKEGAKKLQEISKTYISSKDEEGNDTSKKITMKVDDSTILTTSFSEEITEGALQLSMGTGTTNETIQQYLQQASNISVLLQSGAMPVQYTIDENRFIFSDITNQDIVKIVVIASILFAIMLIWMIIKYKSHGIFSAISCIGFIAILLLVLRFTNVTITMEGLFSIGLAAILDYVLLMVLLKNTKQEQEIKVKQIKENVMKFMMIGIPTVVIAVIFSFSKWMPMFSFGMVLFWGIVILAIYNIPIVKVFLMDHKANKK